MPFRFFFILFLVNSIGFSQSLQIKSSKDSTNIPFVTISYLKDNTTIGGTYTNENGTASIVLQPDTDKIRISHIGFESKTINAGNSANTTVYLDEKIQLLSEVTINKKVSGIPYWTGNRLDKKNIFISAQRGFEITTLIKDSKYSSDKKLTRLKFNIKRRKETNPAIVKLNFYECVNEMPANLINVLDDITVVIPPKSKGEIVVDLEKYNLYLPQEGIFVAVEWMGLADNEGTLLQNDSYNDCSIGYNKTETQNLTFIRNRFSTPDWTHFNLLGNESTVSTIPAFALEVK